MSALKDTDAYLFPTVRSSKLGPCLQLDRLGSSRYERRRLFLRTACAELDAAQDVLEGRSPAESFLTEASVH